MCSLRRAGRFTFRHAGASAPRLRPSDGRADCRYCSRMTGSGAIRRSRRGRFCLLPRRRGRCVLGFRLHRRCPEVRSRYRRGSLGIGGLRLAVCAGGSRRLSRPRPGGRPPGLPGSIVKVRFSLLWCSLVGCGDYAAGRYLGSGRHERGRGGSFGMYCGCASVTLRRRLGRLRGVSRGVPKSRGLLFWLALSDQVWLLTSFGGTALIGGRPSEAGKLAWDKPDADSEEPPVGVAACSS